MSSLPSTPHHLPSFSSVALHVAIGALIAAGLLLIAPPTASSAMPDARLEAGVQTGYRISASGTILASKSTTVTSPTMVHIDRRRTYAPLVGAYLRMTSGPLSGYEVWESPVAYIPGTAGDGAYVPPVSVKFPAGRYLGYWFTSGWDLAATRYRIILTATTAQTSRRMVINGRPYVLPSSGVFAGLWVPVTQPRGLTAQPLACSVPAKPAAGSSAVLRRIATTESKVALTFDMGGRLTPAVDIMERLILDRVCATIFPTGEAAQTTTGRAVMALIKLHPELFEVGNHTVHHCNLRDGTKNDPDCPTTPATTALITSELLDAATIVRDLTGRASAPYWRPPYGAYDTRVRTVAASVGYTKTVMWHIDTIDWRPVKDGGPTAASMIAKVVDGAETGSTVLMHLGGYNTFDALPSMIWRLRADGLTPSTITDLLT